MFDAIERASYRLVHDFNGGAPRLAALTNMNAGTLQHKVNPTMETHHLTLKEAVSLMFVSQDFRLLHAICHELGFACVQSGRLEGLSDVEFLNVYAEAMKKVGKMSEAISDAFDDRRITTQEVKRVHDETLEAITVMAELPLRMEAMCDE
jgi:Phage regulatory protein CII (CP76)